MTRYVDDLRDVLSQGSLTEQKTFIRSFVKEVKVTGKEVVITYTIPLPSKGSLQETAAVLDTIHYGGAGGIRTRYLLTASQALSQLSYSPRIASYSSTKTQVLQHKPCLTLAMGFARIPQGIMKGAVSSVGESAPMKSGRSQVQTY